VTPITYRGFEITPDSVSGGWAFAHPEYDGPEDWRCGTGTSPEHCRREIDAKIEVYTGAEPVADASHNLATNWLHLALGSWEESRCPRR
jgi:hypothetical protein